LHLAEQRADDHDRRHAADLVADVLPRPALLALEIEQLLGEVGAVHCQVLSRLTTRSGRMASEARAGGSPSGGASKRTTGTLRRSKRTAWCSAAKLLLRAMRKSMMWLRTP